MGNYVSNSQQNNQTEPEKLKDVSMKNMTADSESHHRGKLWECMKTHSDYYQPILAAVKSAKKAVGKEVETVLRPSSVGRDVMEWRKDPKAREEVENFYDFMEGGACKESWIAVAQCWNEADVAEEEKYKRLSTLCECAKAHSDYYHPILEPVHKAGEEEMVKELQAFFFTSSDQPKLGEDELTDRILEFMNGGACKESFTAWFDIIMEEVEADTRKQSS